MSLQLINVGIMLQFFFYYLFVTRTKRQKCNEKDMTVRIHRRRIESPEAKSVLFNSILKIRMEFDLISSDSNSEQKDSQFQRLFKI